MIPFLEAHTLFFAILTVFLVFCAGLNMWSAMKGNSVGRVFILHIILAIGYAASCLAFLVGLIVNIIRYVQHGG